MTLPEAVRSQLASSQFPELVQEGGEYTPITTPWKLVPSRAPVTFMNVTLKCNDTIRGEQAFWKGSRGGDGDEGAGDQSTPQDESISRDNSTPDNSTLDSTDSLVTWYSLGLGAQGHHEVSHGGLISVLMDQEMGSVVGMYIGRRSCYTASLTVSYHQPLPVPGEALCTAFVSRTEGRKVWARVRLEAFVAGKRVVVATGEGLFITSQGQLL